MDLLSMFRLVWRLKFVTIPVILLTLAAASYVVAMRKPVYEATSSFVLINPPGPPSDVEIDANPKLADIPTDNPYVRFGSQSVVVDVLARTVSTETSREALVKKGADSRFTVMPSMKFGFGSPIIEITGVGPSEKSAIDTARLVDKAVTDELHRMQTVQHVAPEYEIKPLQVDFPEKAQLRVSGQLRMLVGVLALGGIMLFLVVSIADAFAKARRGEDPDVAAPLLHPAVRQGPVHAVSDPEHAHVAHPAGPPEPAQAIHPQPPRIPQPPASSGQSWAS